jgi:hypothetical protein
VTKLLLRERPPDGNFKFKKHFEQYLRKGNRQNGLASKTAAGRLVAAASPRLAANDKAHTELKMRMTGIFVRLFFTIGLDLLCRRGGQRSK